MRSRLIARLRSDFPVAPFVSVFIVGQFAGFMLSPFYAAGAACAAALIKLVLFRGAAGFWMPVTFMAGIVSGISAVSVPEAAILDPEKSYRGRVTEEPRHPRPGEISFPVEIAGVSGLRVHCRAIDLPWRNSYGLGRGDEIVFTADFRRVKRDLNPFSYAGYLFRYGYHSQCRVRYLAVINKSEGYFFDRTRRAVREAVERIAGNNEQSGLFLSMTIGMRDVLSRDTEEVFKQTGLAHLLVVSGYQVTLVYIMFAGILTRLLLSVRGLHVFIGIDLAASLMALAAACIFILICGVEGSGMRALLASCFTFIARSTERGGGFLNCMLVSLLVLSLIWPGCILEPGVQLTFAALGGICIASFRQTGVLRVFVRVCFLVSVLTSVVVLCWFGGISVMTFVLNPLFAPLISVLSCKAGFAGILLLFSGIDSGGVVIQGVVAVLSLFSEAMHWVAGSGICYFEPKGYLRIFIAMGLIAAAFPAVRRNFLIYRRENCV